MMGPRASPVVLLPIVFAVQPLSSDLPQKQGFAVQQGLTLSSGTAEVRPLDQTIGGGRGVFATRDIRAGEVVHEEKPFLLLPQGRVSSMVGQQPMEKSSREPVFERLARKILSGKDRESLVKKMAILHPCSLQVSLQIVLEHLHCNKTPTPSANSVELTLTWLRTTH